MSRQTQKGRYFIKNPAKYEGDSGNVIFRSSWEKRFMIFLDLHDSVVSWSSEEVVVPYFWEVDGKHHRYYPDFVVTMKTTTGIVRMMIEVKPYAQTIEPKQTPRKRQKTLLLEVETYTKNLAKWRAAEKFCKGKGWLFRLITEKELFKDNKSW